MNHDENQILEPLLGADLARMVTALATLAQTVCEMRDLLALPPDEAPPPAPLFGLPPDPPIDHEEEP